MIRTASHELCVYVGRKVVCCCIVVAEYLIFLMGGLHSL